MAKRYGCKSNEVMLKGKCYPTSSFKHYNEYVGVINIKATNDNKITKLRSPSSDRHWIKGVIPINKNSYYDFEAKVYNEPSKYGIKKGRVSKLLIHKVKVDYKHPWDNDLHKKAEILSYDRGWDKRTDEGKKIMSKILEMFPVVNPEDL